MNGVMVSIEERTRAWENYRKYYPEGASSLVFTKFCALLGSPTDFTADSPFYTYPPEAARKVRLLAGPHYYTFLKAHEALEGTNGSVEHGTG